VAVDKPEIVRLLIANGADVNAAMGPRGSPLHLAVAGRRKPLVDLLLASGANPAVIDAEGNTPLHLAIMQDTAIVHTLLRAGADPSTPNGAGLSAFEIAEQAGNEPVLVLLEASRRDTERSP
jgi:ankyrin repeat protein